MEKFKFQAVNIDGKQVTGAVSAASPEEARQKLTQNRYAVLSIEPYVGKELRDPNNKIFLFGVQLDQDILQKGKIEAADEYEAYQKLRGDYGYDVKYLFPADLPSEQQDARKQQGIAPELITQWGEQAHKRPVKKETHKTTSDKNYEKIVSKHKKEIEALQEEINEVITEVNTLLTQADTFLQPEKKRAIKKRLDLLSRIKQSNSIDHLKSVTKRLLDELDDDLLFLTEVQLTPEQKEQMEAERSKFSALVTKLNTNFTKSLSKIELPISGLDTEAVKKTVMKIHKEINPLQKFGEFLYWMFTFLFGFMLLFWCINGFYYFLSETPAVSGFYFKSPLLWFFTAFTGFVFLIFSAPVLIPQFNQRCRRSLFWTAVVLIFLILVFEFPLLFPWT